MLTDLRRCEVEGDGPDSRRSLTVKLRFRYVAPELEVPIGFNNLQEQPRVMRKVHVKLKISI